MCGRLVIYSPVASYAGFLGAVTAYDNRPSYNIPPSADIPVCRVEPGNGRVLVPAQWGLVPSWSSGPDSRYSMFNARAESVHEKPAFRTAFRKQRCLVPVDGFYEWKKANGKQPYYFYRQTGEPLVLAGLWDQWQAADGGVLDSCTIIVTEANTLMRPVHDRMPVILDPDQFTDWLAPDNHEVDTLRNFLQPYSGNELACRPVSRAVNNPRNDSAELIEENVQPV